MKPNKLIISRKGFDSGSGGCLSPIFPDGTMFSLPIPSWDQEAFEDLQHGDIDIASVVTGVTNGRMSGQNLIHLDPDLNFEAYWHRKERANWQHWRGMLGHSGVSKERTFESSFVIAVRQRRGKPKADAPQPRKASSPPLTADIAKRKTPSTPNPTEIQERQRLETRREYDKRRDQRPERHQSARDRQKKRRQRAKELGICKHCSKPAIPEQTRCPSCAEKHRQQCRSAKAKRQAVKTAARQNKPVASLPRTSDQD